MHKSTSSVADWDLYRYFLAVIECGSLSAAARRLVTTQPTVSRQIARLENALDTKLFTRSPDGLIPTDAARRLYEPALVMANAAAAIQRSAQDDGIGGTLRITVPEVIGVEVLTPLLAEFQAAYPGQHLELSVAEHNEDLLRREADLAVRMQRPEQDALLVRKLGRSLVSLHAHRSYFERRGMPESREALATHSLIGYDRHERLHAHWQTQGFPQPIDALAFRSDCAMARLAALRAGMGIGLCHAHLAAHEADLVALDPKLFSFELEIWLAMHEDQRQRIGLRRLFDFLADRLPQRMKIA
ncbi:LysR family transcriptional regulator [Pseudomonas sp. SO81]|uniref:LysR family transcriptional regulator n=1 Tax=Pseudomonas sp. SO81 TaxID=2983246 RepID=UPI0025A3CA5D|nr:LysR family transcriptional regulator [Pseudomonas sp. SO81]WJN61712.1 Transcriptional regulator, LysR family [Pseudomonas sp. SO81]